MKKTTLLKAALGAGAIGAAIPVLIDHLLVHRKFELPQGAKDAVSGADMTELHAVRDDYMNWLENYGYEEHHLVTDDGLTLNGATAVNLPLQVVACDYEHRQVHLYPLLHEYGKYIIGRMGLPYPKKELNLISIALDAPQDTISALSGKIGKLPGVGVKTAFSNVGAPRG